MPLSSPNASAITPISALLKQRLQQEQPWLSFAQYMEIALYTPELGYYANHQQKFGYLARDGSDFVTAPQLSPLFGKTIAGQLAHIMQTQQLNNILEFGAGNAQLAVDILLALEELQAPPKQYAILEISSVLRQRQQAYLKQRLQHHPHLLECIVWLERLPTAFEGIMLGNEILDAMPVEIYARKNEQWHQRGIAWDTHLEKLIWCDRPAPEPIPPLLHRIEGTHDYITELHPIAEAFIRSLAEHLQRGCILLIDYGFPAQEYYHPQRCQGTAMAHYQHQACTDLFIHPGQADLTAHINFTAITEAAEEAGLSLLGYTTQANFLLNAGLIQHLAQINPDNSAHYLPAARAVQQLVSEAEMGELFKVIAFEKNIDVMLSGFSRGDRSHTL